MYDFQNQKNQSFIFLKQFWNYRNCIAMIQEVKLLFSVMKLDPAIHTMLSQQSLVQDVFPQLHQLNYF